MAAQEFEETPEEIAAGIHAKKQKLLEGMTQDGEGEYTTRDINSYAGYGSNEMRHWFRQSEAEGLIENVGMAEENSAGKKWVLKDRGRAVLEYIGDERSEGPETVQELGERLDAVEAQLDAATMRIKSLQSSIDAESDTGLDADSEAFQEGVRSVVMDVKPLLNAGSNGDTQKVNQRVDELEQMLNGMMDLYEELQAEVNEIQSVVEMQSQG